MMVENGRELVMVIQMGGSWILINLIGLFGRSYWNWGIFVIFAILLLNWRLAVVIVIVTGRMQKLLFAGDCVESVG